MPGILSSALASTGPNRAACRELRASRHRQGLPAGQAVATTAGRLDARWVIHTVGPAWSDPEVRSELLASCYRESLRVADAVGARTVAFPAVSTGVYRRPLDDAARIAVEAVRGAGAAVAEARFVLFDEAAYAAFAERAGQRRPAPGNAPAPGHRHGVRGPESAVGSG